MADKVPIRASYSGANALTGLATFATTETIATTHGGTGASSASGALINLGSTSAGTQTVIQNAANASLASQDASAIILVDLLDPGIIWDYEVFITRSRYTSWFQELGAPPVRGAMWSNNAKTSMVWWNLDTDTSYMTFTVAVNEMAHGPTMEDLFFLDGVFYCAMAGSGIAIIDLLSDSGRRFDTGGISKYKGDVSERNDGNSTAVYNTAEALGSDTVKSVVAHRDGFFVDEFDRPKHWWMAGTNSGPNAYNPMDDEIYTSSDGQISYAAAITTGGKMFITQDFGGVTDADQVVYYQMEKFWADSTSQSNMFGQYLTAAAAGFRSLSFFSSSYVPDTLAAYEISVAGGALGLFGCNEGLVFAHMPPDERANPNEPNGGLILVTSSYQTPYMKGARLAAYPLNDVNDRSGAGYNLTNNNTVTFTSGIFGSIATFDGVDQYLSKTSGITAVACKSAMWWAKSTSATNPSGTEYVARFRRNSDGAGLWFAFNTSGQMIFHASSDGSGQVQLTANPDTYDAVWHHYAYTLREDGSWYAYIDGIEVKSGAGQTAGAPADTIAIGAAFGSNYFAGQMAMVAVSEAMLTDSEIKFEYQRGLRSLGGATHTLANTDVTSVRVDQNTGLAAITTAANQTEIWDATMGLRESIDSTTTATIADADVSLKTGAENPEYITGRSGAIEYDGKVRRVLG